MIIRTATTVILAVSLLCVSAVCFANPVDIDVSATVPAILDLNYSIKYFMDANNTPIGDDDDFGFGSLTHTLANGSDAGVWFSRKWFTIYMVASTGGQRYQIKQTCLGVTSGGNNINNSFVVTPNYSEDDLLGTDPQGPIPGTIGVPSLAVVSNHVMYTSDTAGEGRVIQGIYSIPNDHAVSGFVPVSLDQPQGLYDGIVTIEAVLF
ncbi:hypothetical protein ACFL1E_06440 [Candidatus Omnitrophota bacterium]